MQQMRWLEEFSVHITEKHTNKIKPFREDDVASYCDGLLWSTVREYKTRRPCKSADLGISTAPG